jgi:hypothetical protein
LKHHHRVDRSAGTNFNLTNRNERCRQIHRQYVQRFRARRSRAGARILTGTVVYLRGHGKPGSTIGPDASSDLGSEAECAGRRRHGISARLTVSADRLFRRAIDTVKNTVNFLRLLRGCSKASPETCHVIQWLVVRSRLLMIETTSFTTWIK